MARDTDEMKVIYLNFAKDVCKEEPQIITLVITVRYTVKQFAKI